MDDPLVDYASVDDVATTLGRPITEPDEVKQVGSWIQKVQRRIYRKLGDLGQLDADALRDVIAEVVARRVRNPEGKRSERIDDYSFSLDADAAKSGLYITDEEWDLLIPDVSVDGAFTIGANPGLWFGPKPISQTVGEWL